MKMFSLNYVIIFISLLFCFTLLSVTNVAGYNLSPRPNAIIQHPEPVQPINPKYESSYFGFTVNLRPLGIIVGAPRAQSTLESQRNVNETGAIYRCSLLDSTCYPYVFDSNGNKNSEYNEYTFDSQKRDFQWLGGSMDGGTRDTDKLLVCAPRFVAPAPNDYLLHGMCYWINDTLSEKPENVQKLWAVGLKTDQIRTENGEKIYYYMLAEQGISAHITDNNEEFLIGAPGIHTWKGSVIRYRKNAINTDPSLSRRDTEAVAAKQQQQQQHQHHQHHRRHRRQRREIDDQIVIYQAEIPNPKNFDQPSDSYFGYAVSSGYFDSNDPDNLMYVATAPQANEQSGEAYIFSYNGNGSSITKHYVFRGEQFGEYFGYAVLADDLNGDGLTDVIVSAPQYSISDYYEDGAIYIFTNKGQFSFERLKLVSPVRGMARFGTTLSRLGDINRDGYFDVAVGAPFAGNGSVFIYMGSRRGLREQASQRLNSPLTTATMYGGVHMFGHGLSKGSDIDDNGFADLAIGAPNAEMVFLYRAYPVVRILASIQSETREIKPDQKQFGIRICYGISTASTQMSGQEVALRIVLDPQVKRVKFQSSNSNEMILNRTAKIEQQCMVEECNVVFNVADIFKPIEMEINYELINGVPDSEEFCSTCAAVDPAEAKVYTEKIIFSTGCVSSICVADMKIKSSGIDPEYILGSSRVLTVVYDISNHGETAYLPQINITSSNRMPFAKIPFNCEVIEDVQLLCYLNRGQPMTKDVTDQIKVTYDVSGIMGTSMTLIAAVFSTGNELTPDDNKVQDVIMLTEFTEIEIVGLPKTPHINLEKVHNSADITNNYEIKSNGPSNVGAMEISFYIPIAYKIAGSSATIPIIEMSNITMQAVYDTQLMAIDFYDNQTQILMNSIEMGNVNGYSTSIMSSSENSFLKDYHETSFHSLQSNEFKETGVVLIDKSKTMATRRKRQEIAAALTASKEEYARIGHVKAYDLLNEDLKGKLPVNRTIVFNCNDREMTHCIRAVLHVYNFKPEKPITVSMKYHIDLNEVNAILIEPWEFFVVLIDVDVSKPSDPMGDSLAINRKMEYNIVSKHQLYGTPLWVIILAILGGLLALALITYGMYKAGFFKRTTKEEMDKLVHQAEASSDGVTEASNLNVESNRNDN